MPLKTSPESTTSQQNARAHDVALIHEVVAQVQTTQCNRDPEDFMRLVASEAVWVTALGKRLTGRDEINAFTQKVLTPALGEHYAAYEVAHITFLSETVAAVNVVQRPIDRNGNPDGDEPEGRPLYVMTKVNGNWRIAIAQNTRFQGDAITAQMKAAGGQE